MCARRSLKGPILLFLQAPNWAAFGFLPRSTNRVRARFYFVSRRLVTARSYESAPSWSSSDEEVFTILDLPCDTERKERGASDSQCCAIMKALALLVGILVACSGCGKLGERFRTVETKNMWTHLLLDSRTGQVWQVSQTKAEGTVKIAINDRELGSGLWSSNGRFELRPTPNIWNFMLTDTKTGKVWRCQFSMDDPKLRYLEPVQ